MRRLAPCIFAHQGARAVAPANTLAAFRAARDLGADGVELDVRLSADGEPVVIHDDVVDYTTDGRGRVRDMRLGQLKRLDAGSWFRRDFAGERIPTLDEAFDVLPPPLQINVEIKSVSVRGEGLEAQVVEIVRRHGAVARVILSSFNPLSILRVKLIAPTLQTGLLYAADLPVYLARAWLRPVVRPDALHPHHSLVTPATVAWAEARGYQVNTWTVNDPGRIRELAEMGVRAIITDHPEIGRAVLDAEQGG